MSTANRDTTVFELRGMRQTREQWEAKAISCAQRTLRQAPRVQSLSSRSRWCAAKHPDGYRDTVYRQIG